MSAARTEAEALPGVTYILTAYQHARFAEQALASAFAQDYPGRIEFMMVDDGSKDGTADIMRRCASLRPDREIVDLSDGINRGLVTNINRAVRQSSGEIIFTQSCDDVSHPHRVSTFVRFYQNNPHIKACYGGVRKIDENGVLAGGVYEVEDPTRPLSEAGNMPIGNGANESFRRSMIQELGYLEELRRVAEDCQISLLGHVSGGIGYLPEVTMDYRIHGANWSAAGEEASRRPFNYGWWEYSAQSCFDNARAMDSLLRRPAVEKRCDPVAMRHLARYVGANLRKQTVNYHAFFPQRGDRFYSLLFTSGLGFGKIALCLSVRLFQARGLRFLLWVRRLMHR
jgi:glycosyltransferase involved in cell wall biosynthesis